MDVDEGEDARTTSVGREASGDDATSPTLISPSRGACGDCGCRCCCCGACGGGCGCRCCCGCGGGGGGGGCVSRCRSGCRCCCNGGGGYAGGGGML